MANAPAVADIRRRYPDLSAKHPALGLAELRTATLAKSALEWLSHRSVLLRPEFGRGASTGLLRLTFSHLQFREYLAGARLAEWSRDHVVSHASASLVDHARSAVM